MTPIDERKLEMALIQRIYYGKFKGKTFDEIPSGYIRWLAENSRDDVVATKASLVFEYREETGTHFWD